MHCSGNDYVNIIFIFLENTGEEFSCFFSLPQYIDFIFLKESGEFLTNCSINESVQ